MKRITITLFVTFLLFAAKAQFTFGPKAGLNIAQMHFSSKNYSTSPKPYFYGGLFGNYAINKSWSVQLEASYAGEGSSEKYVGSGASSETKGHISEAFLQVPLLAQFHTSMGFFAEAGPQVGFLLSIKEIYGTSSNSNTNIKQYYNTVDFRVPLGVGYVFPESSPVKGLGVNARYSFEFSKINKTSVGGESLKNRVFSIGAFYKIPMKKKK